MMGQSVTRVTDVLEVLFVTFLVILTVLPVVDLVDQTRGAHGDPIQQTGTMAVVMGHNFSGGESLYGNQTRIIAAEMRDKTRSRGTGTTRTITSGNRNSISQRLQQQGNQQQQHHHLSTDMKDASSSSSQSLAFPSAFDMFPGLSSSSSSSAAQDSGSYEEEFEEEQRRLLIPKPTSTKLQPRHHQHSQHGGGENAHTIGSDVSPSLHHSSRGGGGSSNKLWGGSNKKQLVFLVEPPMPLASSSRVTGPYFDSNQTTIHISAKAGQNVVLDCTVILLQGRTVSWLRRGNDSLQLLTVGNTTYYNDPRLGLRFRYPNNWRLGIDSVSKADEGEYQCQLSTHPVKTLIYHLKVIAPVVVILDENGHSVSERHYKVDSSLHLTCRASHVDKFVDKVVWLKGDRALSGTDNRIKIKVTKNEEIDETMVYLSVLSLHKGDSGNYSCRAGFLAKYTVTVHVVNGELPAAVQHESRATRLSLSLVTVCFTLLLSASTTPSSS